MRKLTIMLIGLAAAGMISPALADRAPTADERTAVETALRGHGYVSWEDIEFDDDGYWEVDDARKANGGNDVDLKLKPGTFEILNTDG